MSCDSCFNKVVFLCFVYFSFPFLPIHQTAPVDALVYVLGGEQQFITQVKKKTSNPQWQERFIVYPTPHPQEIAAVASFSFFVDSMPYTPKEMRQFPNIPLS